MIKNHMRQVFTHFGNEKVKFERTFGAVCQVALFWTQATTTGPLGKASFETTRHSYTFQKTHVAVNREQHLIFLYKRFKKPTRLDDWTFRLPPPPTYCVTYLPSQP